jgi:hypothetical protein
VLRAVKRLYRLAGEGLELGLALGRAGYLEIR